MLDMRTLGNFLCAKNDKDQLPPVAYYNQHGMCCAVPVLPEALFTL